MHNELYHHGIKGMKWGVRKSERREQRNQRKAHNRKYNAKRVYRNRYKYSDQELKQITNRIQNEQQLQSLARAQSSPMKRIASAVGKQVVNAGVNQVSNYAVKQVGTVLTGDTARNMKKKTKTAAKKQVQSGVLAYNISKSSRRKQKR